MFGNDNVVRIGKRRHEHTHTFADSRRRQTALDQCGIAKPDRGCAAETSNQHRDNRKSVCVCVCKLAFGSAVLWEISVTAAHARALM